MPVTNGRYLQAMSDVSNAAILEYLEQFSATTAESFQKVDARFNRIEMRLDSLEIRVTGLEGSVRGLGLRMDRLEGRMDGLECRMDRLEECVRDGFSGVNERLLRLEAA